MISHPQNHFDDDPDDRDRDFNKSSRFNVYDDPDQLVLMRKPELENLKLRFKELCDLASIVLDTSPENIERDQVMDFIENNKEG